jgi:preprotein translocase subunit YajC
MERGSPQMLNLAQMLLGLSDAATATATDTTTATTTSSSSDILTLVIPMVLMFAVFYFLLIRPQRKKDKKVKDMLSALKVGDRISTIGGIFGTITSIKDDTFEVTVGKDNVKLIMARWAIRQVEDGPVENDKEVLN